MGSFIEINDTLKISKERGFPKEVTLEKHLNKPFTEKDFEGKEFTFWNPNERYYHHPPTRVFLVEEMDDGKWLYWGHALIIEQTITQGKTQGKYIITRVYPPEYQKTMTINETSPGKSYF